MGLFNVYNHWNKTRYQNFVSTMKEQGKCPECRGKGYIVHPYNEFTFYNSYDCPGCHGSGLYQDWEEMK